MGEILRFHEITELGDELLIPWLDLYEMAFPPEERVLVSSFLRLIKQKAAGEREDSHMTAVLDEADEFVGLVRYDVIPEIQAAYLWYLAVVPEARNRGLGGLIHESVIDEVRQAGMRAAVLEVEMPEIYDDAEHREIAARRIEFYRRHGALLLKGISYVHSVAPHQPETLMHIMVHPTGPITPREAFDLAKSLFGDCITQVGALELE